jgi:toxin ParE1/3/4
LNDIKDQIARIAADSPSAAKRVRKRLHETGLALGTRAIGRAGRVEGTFEKTVTGLPYIIAYAITHRAGQETVSILRVIHAARDWPPGRWPR